MARRSKARRASTRRFVSRKSRSSGSKAMFNLGKIKIYKSDLFEVAGAAGAGTLGSLANKVTGGRVVGNTAQALGAVGLSLLGGRNGTAVAKGALMKTAGDYTEDNVLPQLFNTVGSNSATQNQGSNDGWN